MPGDFRHDLGHARGATTVQMVHESQLSAKVGAEPMIRLRT